MQYENKEDKMIGYGSYYFKAFNEKAPGLSEEKIKEIKKLQGTSEGISAMFESSQDISDENVIPEIRFYEAITRMPDELRPGIPQFQEGSAGAAQYQAVSFGRKLCLERPDDFMMVNPSLSTGSSGIFDLIWLKTGEPILNVCLGMVRSKNHVNNENRKEDFLTGLRKKAFNELEMKMKTRHDEQREFINVNRNMDMEMDER